MFFEYASVVDYYEFYFVINQFNSINFFDFSKEMIFLGLNKWVITFSSITNEKQKEKSIVFLSSIFISISFVHGYQLSATISHDILPGTWSKQIPRPLQNFNNSKIPFLELIF